MSTAIALTGLYHGAINLWVEDLLTRDYLATVWKGDPAFVFLVGGGNDGVRAVVNDARVNGIAEVFGLIDRDFRSSNRKDWSDLNKNPRLFVPSVHELENFLIDPSALEGCDVNNIGRSRSEIQGLLEAKARTLCWWMACREIVAHYAANFRNDFTGHPPTTITDAAAAEAHVCDSPWFASFPEKVAMVQRAEVVRRLYEAHAHAEAQVDSGEWQDHFSGKELFRDIRSRI